MQLGDVCTFYLGTGVKSGIVIKLNHQTVHVKMKDGNIVKRHLDKHILTSHSSPVQQEHTHTKNTQS